MSEKVEILAKVISESNLTLPEMHDLHKHIDSLLWNEAVKTSKELEK